MRAADVQRSPGSLGHITNQVTIVNVALWAAQPTALSSVPDPSSVFTASALLRTLSFLSDHLSQTLVRVNPVT